MDERFLQDTETSIPLSRPISKTRCMRRDFLLSGNPARQAPPTRGRGPNPEQARAVPRNSLFSSRSQCIRVHHSPSSACIDHHSKTSPHARAQEPHRSPAARATRRPGRARDRLGGEPIVQRVTRAHGGARRATHGREAGGCSMPRVRVLSCSSSSASTRCHLRWPSPPQPRAPGPRAPRQ